MTSLTASSKYTALNNKEYPAVTEQDILDLYKQGLGYNDIVNLLNSNNVDMAGMRTDMYGGVNKGKSTEEVMTKMGGNSYYDGGSNSPTSGSIQYFMTPTANTALSAVSLAEEYNKMTPEEKEKSNMNSVYGSEADIFKAYGLSYGDTSTSPATSQTTPTSTSSTSSSSWSPTYGVAPKPSPSSQTTITTEYIPWDAQFGMSDSKNGDWLDSAMMDAVGVGFTDTSKGQTFENVLNSTEKKPVNTASGPQLFETIMNSY